MSRANPRFRRSNPPLPGLSTNLYQASVLFQLQNQQMISTYYYSDGQAPGTGVSPTLLANGVNALLSQFQSIMATNCQVYGTTVRCLNNPTFVSITKFLSVSLSGTVAGNALGTVPGPVILRQTAWRGQAGRGRVSPPGMPASFITPTGEQLTQAAVTTYTTWGNNFLMASITSGGLTFVPYLYSRGLRTQTPKVPGAAQLLSFLVKPLVGTVRRRKIGRGK